MAILNEPVIIGITDDDITNSICNEYYYQYFLKTKGMHLSKKRNFSKLKTTKPSEWENFKKLQELCSTNNIDYKKYITFALDEIIKVHKFIHLKYLLNPRYVVLYNENITIDIQYKKINGYILMSFKTIIALCNANNINTFTGFIKYLIKEQKLGHFIKCGVVSKYILALIPNIKELKCYFDEESAQELQIYVINRYDKLLNDAKIALEHYDNFEYINIVKKFNQVITKNNT